MLRLPLLLDGADIADETVKADTAMVIAALRSSSALRYAARLWLPLLLDGADIADETVKADTAMVIAALRSSSALRYAAILWYL